MVRYTCIDKYDTLPNKQLQHGLKHDFQDLGGGGPAARRLG